MAKKGTLRIIDVKSGQVEATLLDVVHHSLSSRMDFPPVKEQVSLAAVCNTVGTLSVWLLYQGKAVRIWKSGPPDLQLHGADLSAVQGLSHDHELLFLQHNPHFSLQTTRDHLRTQLKKAAKTHDETTEKLYGYLEDEEYDTDAITMDIEDAAHSNIHAFDRVLYPRVVAFMPTPKVITYPQGEVAIPANGLCLYTALLVGYLVLALGRQDFFEGRCRNALGYLPDLRKKILSPQDFVQLTYLGSLSFQKMVTSFMMHMNIDPSSTWGGPEEMQRIATSLGVNIEVYTPDPEDPNYLVPAPLVNPSTGHVETTLSLVQDSPTSEEAEAPKEDPDIQLASAQIAQQRQHYRAYFPPDASAS